MWLFSKLSKYNVRGKIKNIDNTQVNQFNEIYTKLNKSKFKNIS